VRIAIYHNLPSGGGKRALYEMSRRLAEHHEIQVYTLSTADHIFCDLRPHCRAYVIHPFRPAPLARRPFGRLNQGIRGLDLFRLRTLQRQIAAQIDAAGHDVVFVHNCQFGQSPGLLSFLRTPSVYYCAEPPRQIYEPPADRPYGRYSRAQRLGNLIDPFPGLYRRTLTGLDRKNVRAARLVLVNSAYSRESLYRVYGIFAQVGYLGVDTERFRPLGLPKDDYVLSVGALNPRKGFDFLIQVLALLGTAQRPRLILASNQADEREQQYLAQLAARLQVEVDFQHQISDAALVELYNRARVTVYTPVMEPFGFVPLESMACETPVLGVREGGVRESVVDGVTGRLADRDPESVAVTLDTMLSHPDLLAAMGVRGRMMVSERWSWEESVARIERHLEKTAELCHSPALY
jgi:glycosyltransferase involved in cell wall biosynthesis